MLMDAVIIFSNNGHHQCQGQLPLLWKLHHCEAAQALQAHMSLHFCGLFTITSVCCKRKWAFRGLWFPIKLNRKIKSPADRKLGIFFSQNTKASGYLYDKLCHDKSDLPSIAVNIQISNARQTCSPRSTLFLQIRGAWNGCLKSEAVINTEAAFW